MLCMFQVKIGDLCLTFLVRFFIFVYEDEQGNEPVLVDLTRKESMDVAQGKLQVFLCDRPLFRDNDPKEHISLAVLPLSRLEKTRKDLRLFGIGKALKV